MATQSHENRQHYKFIANKDDVGKFERMFYRKGEMHFIYLAARKKYAAQIGLDKSFDLGAFEKRTFTVHDDATDYMLSMFISRFETAIGSYYAPNSKPIPNEIIAVYASLSPRDIKRAINELTKHLVNTALDSPNGATKKDADIIRLYQKCGHKRFLTIDIDTHDQRTIFNIMRDLHANGLIDIEEPSTADFIAKLGIDEVIAPNDVKCRAKYCIIKTRGGYHVIYNKSTLTGDNQKFMFTKLKQLHPEYIDKIISDMFSPIPGTYQGGVAVTFAAVNTQSGENMLVFSDDE